MMSRPRYKNPEKSSEKYVVHSLKNSINLNLISKNLNLPQMICIRSEIHLLKLHGGTLKDSK